MDRRGKHSGRGGKAGPVDEQAHQLQLFHAPAENSGEPEIEVRSQVEPSTWPHTTVPKARRHEREDVSTISMEDVVSCLRRAFDKVAANKGAPGPDGQTINELRRQLGEVLPRVSKELQEGRYLPGKVRRKYIPKAGGQRGLGIPNVIDRVVGEAMRMTFEPLYEPNFHPSSHGFRPRRSCHTAICEAKEHMKEGRVWVVDIDLEKFFDRVCHQRLLDRLSQKIKDRRILKVLKRMLKAKVVMPDGVVVKQREGVPQGGPLSPMLSNIVLDELDQELKQRGHSFVRYADDVNIFVSSERAGRRVMTSISRFIEKRMRLKVNQEKSAVARPKDRHFLGFRLDDAEGQIEVRLSERTLKRIKQRIVELTPRNWGNSMERCVERINKYLKGWMGFFGICSKAEMRKFRTLDAHIRRRLRAIKLKQWKRRKTIAQELIKLGVRAVTAWNRVYGGRKGWWALSHDVAVHQGLGNSFIRLQWGLLELTELWLKPRRKLSPGQLWLWG